MRTRRPGSINIPRVSGLATGVVASLALLLGGTASAQERTMSQIPKSIQVEHGAIHDLLVEATQQPGRVGQAAKALAAVLHPHFVREEQIALPPLGELRRLAAGEQPASAAAAMAMADTLKSELPRMLEEHKRIHAAVDELRVAARAEHATKYEQLAEQLALHALTEEEVLYPTAILVGELIRARGFQRPPGK